MESMTSFSIDENIDVACISCTSKSGNVFTAAEWQINYLDSAITVSNTYSPNTSLVEVIKGVLGVKKPSDQLINGFYEINAYCSEDVTYALITLFAESKFMNL